MTLGHFFVSENWSLTIKVRFRDFCQLSVPEAYVDSDRFGVRILLMAL